MSQKQLNRFSVISKLIDGHVTIAEAPTRLGISERQVIRLKKGIISEGPSFLIHILPDVLAENLRLVICGTAVATQSVKAESYYVGTGDKFWQILYNTGLTINPCYFRYFSTLYSTLAD
jgi:hypothetical protein